MYTRSTTTSCLSYYLESPSLGMSLRRLPKRVHKSLDSRELVQLLLLLSLFTFTTSYDDVPSCDLWLFLFLFLFTSQCSSRFLSFCPLCLSPSLCLSLSTLYRYLFLVISHYLLYATIAQCLVSLFLLFLFPPLSILYPLPYLHLPLGIYWIIGLLSISLMNNPITIFTKQFLFRKIVNSADYF